MKYCFIIVFLFPFLLYGQNIDSLKLVLKSTTNDTLKCRILNTIIEAENDDAVWPAYNEQLKKLCLAKLSSVSPKSPEYKVYKKYYSASLNNLGYLADNNGDIIKALDYYKKSLAIDEEINNKEGIAATLNNIGFIYKNQGDITNAIEYYGKSLEIQEELGDKEGIVRSLINIGSITQNQGDYAKAISYYARCLKTSEEINYKEGIFSALNNMALLYDKQKQGALALTYFKRSVKLMEETGDNIGMAAAVNNIGLHYFRENDYDKALEYYMRALSIQEQIGDYRGKAISLLNTSQVYFNLNNQKKSIEYANKSLDLATKYGYLEIIKDASIGLYLSYKKTNNPVLALKNHELSIKMRDSLNNSATQKATIRQQTKYEYDLKKAVDNKQHELELQHHNEVAIAEKNKQNIIIFSVSIVLLLVGVFSLFLFNRFKVTQRQKLVIETKEKETQHQKEIIEEKHKEITDSINYAERIQTCFLASENIMATNLPQHFVFFKPKAVVSGDFYWASKLSNGNFALVTADSTGHGVPGAIMSLLNITSLEKAIEQSSNPAEILNLTRANIIERLSKDGSAEGGKDGMDCSLVSFNANKKTMEVAAANNPVWIIRNVSSSARPNDGSVGQAVENNKGNLELIEVKPDKMPVGKHEKDSASFTLHSLDLIEGDMVYTLSDGFPDQFGGGGKGKKFMTKKLKELLIEISSKPIQEQNEIITTTFNNWIGNLEQVDDVTLIGIRV